MLVSFGSTCMNEQIPPTIKPNKSYLRATEAHDYLEAALRPARAD
jgi:hypothetical protein